MVPPKTPLLSFPSAIFLLLLFFKDLFQSSFRFRVKLRGRCRNFPYTPSPHTCIASHSINITPRIVLFFLTKDEPTLTHHNHPKSIHLPSYALLGAPVCTSRPPLKCYMHTGGHMLRRRVSVKPCHAENIRWRPRRFSVEKKRFRWTSQLT